MVDDLNLNLRHKAGLFLVLVAVGVSLLLDATAKQTVGVVVLGIAVAWAFGSLSLRTLGFISCAFACAAGLGILGIPVWHDWNSYRASVQDYDSAIAEIREAVTKADVWVDVPPNRQPKMAQDDIQGLPAGAVVRPLGGASHRDIKGLPEGADVRPIGGTDIKEHSEKDVTIPEAAWKWIRVGAEAKTVEWDVSGNVTRIVEYFPGNSSDEQIVSAFQTKTLRPRPTFSIRRSLSSHRLPSLIGVTLLVAGLLGNGLFFVRLRKSRREARVSPA